MSEVVNKHLVDLVNEFPRLVRTELAAALAVPVGTFNAWVNKKEENRKLAPEWTKDVVGEARKRLIEVNKDRFMPVAAQAAPVQQTVTGGGEEQLFIVSVPASKINQFKGIVTMIGGNLVDM